jgi:hypothetical protein
MNAVSDLSIYDKQPLPWGTTWCGVRKSYHLCCVFIQAAENTSDLFDAGNNNTHAGRLFRSKAGMWRNAADLFGSSGLPDAILRYAGFRRVRALSSQAS